MMEYLFIYWNKILVMYQKAAENEDNKNIKEILETINLISEYVSTIIKQNGIKNLN